MEKKGTIRKDGKGLENKRRKENENFDVWHKFSFIFLSSIFYFTSFVLYPWLRLAFLLHSHLIIQHRYAGIKWIKERPTKGKGPSTFPTNMKTANRPSNDLRIGWQTGFHMCREGGKSRCAFIGRLSISRNGDPIKAQRDSSKPVTNTHTPRKQIFQRRSAEICVACACSWPRFLYFSFMAISMRFYSLGSNNRHGNGHEGKGKFTGRWFRSQLIVA